MHITITNGARHVYIHKCPLIRCILVELQAMTCGRIDTQIGCYGHHPPAKLA